MYAIAVALCVLWLSGSSASAQAQAPAASPASPSIDAEKLPTSLGRIRLKLAAPDKGKSPLKIEQVIEVVGVAPPIELWNPDTPAGALRGPAPFGAPTQKDILDLTTPQEFRTRAIDIPALLRWLAERRKGKTSE